MARPSSLVRPLEAEWQAVLDAVLRPMGRPDLSTRDVARLAPAVKALSAAYNAAKAEGGRTKLPLEARVAFSFPRDVPKGAGAVRELVASGALSMPADRPLRVLDLGAGLGAMTWGIVRALEASGASGKVEALLVDEDDDALQKAVAIAREAKARLGKAAIELSVTTRRLSITASDPSLPVADVVILGQVLSEVDPREEPEARLERHTSLVTGIIKSLLRPDGALVIVEPALRDRTRHLHALRDRLLERDVGTVFAPCLHASRCPILPLETEWRHEDLAIDLPAWVVPLARAAGLRWQGLTFSYLVLRRDGRTPTSRTQTSSTQVRFRAVSDLLRSKGKAELVVCDEAGERKRIRRLERDARFDSGVSFFDLRRGDIVTLSSIADAADTLEMPAETARDSSSDVRSPIDAGGRVSGKTHGAIDVGASRK